MTWPSCSWSVNRATLWLDLSMSMTLYWVFVICASSKKKNQLDLYPPEGAALRQARSGQMGLTRGTCCRSATCACGITTGGVAVPSSPTAPSFRTSVLVFDDAFCGSLPSSRMTSFTLRFCPPTSTPPTWLTWLISVWYASFIRVPNRASEPVIGKSAPITIGPPLLLLLPPLPPPLPQPAMISVSASQPAPSTRSLVLRNADIPISPPGANGWLVRPPRTPPPGVSPGSPPRGWPAWLAAIRIAAGRAQIDLGQVLVENGPRRAGEHHRAAFEQVRTAGGGQRLRHVLLDQDQRETAPQHLPEAVVDPQGHLGDRKS